MSYAEFLSAKTRRAHPSGIDAALEDVHPSLFPFQRDIVRWACQRGRAAVFADTGLGKTRIQVEWARLMADRALIVAPLSVARQTVAEAAAINVNVRYVRHGDQADGTGLFITNYEMVDRFDPDTFGAVVLDESSILKNDTGKRRTDLIRRFRAVPYRLACTATPAPNDVVELCNHAEFLSVMPRREMLAAFFIHDDVGWRLKGHAAGPMFKWMATWAVALRRPSDLGYADDGYNLPPLRIADEVVPVIAEAPGRLFPTDLGGIGGRQAARRHSLERRVERAVQLASDAGQWIVWCGLNDEADAVEDTVDDAVNVPGAWTPERKAEALAAFQDGEIRVLVSKPSICGFGMNFQNCHQMTFVGLGDSYEQYYQAIRRCWRFGQTRPVDVRIIISDIEGAVAANVRRKEKEAARLIDQLVAAMRGLAIERAG
jgi:helicase-like protein